MSRLFIGNVEFNATEQDIRDFFVGHGVDLERVIIPPSGHHPGSGCGYVFVDIPDEQRATVMDLQGELMLGRPIRVAPPRERAQGDKGGERK